MMLKVLAADTLTLNASFVAPTKPSAGDLSTYGGDGAYHDADQRQHFLERK